MSKIDDVFIAAPCRYGWQNMRDAGEANIRFCDGCEMPVYDLSTMTRDEINHLLDREGDSVCLRLMRDSGGEIVSRENRFGLFLQHRLHTLVVSCFAFLLAIPLAFAKGSEKGSTIDLDKSNSKDKKSGIDLRYLTKPKEILVVDGRPCLIRKTPSSSSESRLNTNTKSDSFSPSWLAKLSIGKDLSVQDALDVKVFQLYKEAREAADSGRCTDSLILYKNAMELAEKSRHDPKFVEFIGKEYEKQQAVHRTDPNHFHGYIQGRSLRQPNTAPTLPAGADGFNNKRKD